MNPNASKELKVAYGIAIVLLIVGVLSYTAFSGKVPDEPLRIVYTGVGGSVMFDHATHAYGYDLACTACHHHPEEPDAMQSCSACHVLPKDGSLPVACLDCHAEDEVGLDSVPKKTDAFHSQCTGCHQEMGAGPVECAACHGL
jgi:hypothetical protein